LPVKLIVGGRLDGTLTALQAGLLLASNPDRYRPIPRGTRVCKLIDRLAPTPLSRPTWACCWRTAEAAVLPPTLEWLRSVGYGAATS
jgi:hypothetical protein